MKPARLAIFALLALALAGLALGLAAYSYVETPRGVPGQVLVEVPPGSSARQVAAILEREGVIDRRWAFTRFMRLSGAHRAIKAGEYAFELPIAPIDVMRALRDGRVVTLAITVPEGLTVEETAGLLAAAGIAEQTALMAAFRDSAAIAEIDPAASDLEGYLFPETYRFERQTSPSVVASEMVREFRRRFAQPQRARIEESELGLRQLVTLASLVEKETSVPSERATVAGVYLERLSRGMLMQCDPTIIYAKKLAGEWDGNIRRSDLTWDHPYNTYVRPGLPPGPIASAGLASLMAALEPERTGDLYFVARGDGSHVFSRTLEQHNRYVREFQLRGSKPSVKR